MKRLKNKANFIFLEKKTRYGVYNMRYCFVFWLSTTRSPVTAGGSGILSTSCGCSCGDGGGDGDGSGLGVVVGACVKKIDEEEEESKTKSVDCEGTKKGVGSDCADELCVSE